MAVTKIYVMVIAAMVLSLVCGARAAEPIKVGIIISHATATAASPNGEPWGYNKQTRIARELQSPDIQLHPIIEPGTENDDGVAVQLERYFSGRQAIDGTDSAALTTLDVILSNENWVTSIDLLKAVESAVSGGVGLLNCGGIGGASPGLTADNPHTARLAGFDRAWFGNGEGAVPCQVLIEHPILGEIAIEAAAGNLRMRPNGLYGVLAADGVPLVKVTDMAALKTFGPNPNDAAELVFFPLYLGKLGKGRIVGCQYAPWGPASDSLQDAGRAALFVRSVRWLADRPVE